MTADLTAIVEAAAEAAYEGARGDSGTPWSERDRMLKHHVREQVLPIITATLKAALGPLADEAETWAKHCDEQGDLALVASKDKEAARAYQARDTHNSYAKRLRAISEGKS